MDIVILCMRILLLVIGSLVGLAYLLFQLFQKFPINSYKLSTADYIVLIVISLIFGFGTNSYFGLAAFVPFLVIKYLCKFMIQPSRLKGSGRWVEVDWRKLTPRGFERNVPKNIMDEMNKMPSDTHFIIPRLYMLILIKFVSKRMNREMKKAPAGFSQTQQQMAFGQFTSLIDGIVQLPQGKSEKKDFPFGVLKITRL